MEYKVEDTQKIIQRFAWQSFGIKGFSFTFLGLILNIVYNEQSNLLILLAIISVFIFWYLDAFYLRMERIYRKIEQEGISKGLNYNEYNEIKSNVQICNTFFSKTILLIYIIQIAFIVISCYIR